MDVKGNDEIALLPSLQRAMLLREQIYRMLRERILNGGLSPGCRLIEEELAEQMNVSRTPVREALQRLKIEGLAVEARNRGYEVASMELEDIDGALEIRRLLECYAARRAAARITEDELGNLQRICEKEREYLRDDPSPFLDELISLNRDFHHQIGVSAKNPTLSLVLLLLSGELTYQIFALGSLENIRIFAKSHNRLVDALKRHDPNAAESEAAFHIDLARKVLLNT